MKTFSAGAAFVAILVLANVVAAGVFAVLGPLATELADETAQIATMALVGVLAVACALLFIKGALFYAAARSFAAHPDPNKGLKSNPAGRGG